MENDRQLRLLTDTPAPGTELGQASIAGNAATLTATLAAGLHTSIHVDVSDAAGNAALGPDDNADNRLQLTVDATAPNLTIARPGDGDTLLAEDDEDGNPGDDRLGYTARFNLSGAATLGVALNAAPVGAPVNDPAASVDQGVVFVEGPNTLVATATDSAGNATERTAQVTAAPRRPVLTITAPVDSTTFGDGAGKIADLDLERGGFQVDVTVATQHLAAGRGIEIISDRAGGIVSDAAVAEADGSTTIRCSLPPGEQTLLARGSDAHGNVGESAGVDVTVEVVGCGFVYTTPRGSPAYVNIANDGNSELAGGQLNIAATVQNNACSGLEAELLVGGVQHATADITAGGAVAFANVTLDEGTRSIDIRVQLDGAPTLAGEKTVIVDLTAPTVVFSSPVDGDELAVANDLDPNTDGLQCDVQMTVGGAQAGTLELLDGQDEIGRLDDLSADAAQNLREVSLADGSHDVTARVTDPAGNATEATITVAVDTVAPANIVGFDVTRTDWRRPSVDLTWTAAGDDGNAGGPVAGYQVKYSPNAIDADNFEDACDGDVVVVPAAPGAGQRATIVGPGTVGGCEFHAPDLTVTDATLDADDKVEVRKTYHFAVRAVDDLGNASDVVTGSTETTRLRAYRFPDPGVTAWGGGGGLLGDVNDDGLDDIGIASWEDGFAYIQYGAADPADSVRQELKADALWYGFLFTRAGDLNGDGIDDFVAGDGCVIDVFLGTSDPQVSTDPVLTLAADDGSCGVWFQVVDRAGNFDNDFNGAHPVEDLLLGIHTENGNAGAAYILRGRTVWPANPINISTNANAAARDAENAQNGIIRFAGAETAGVTLGSHVHGIGDGDGDGFSDVVVGAPLADGGNGRAYLVRGRSAAQAQETLTDGSRDVIELEAPLPNLRFGASGSGFVDLSGDGQPDLTVGTSASNHVFVFNGQTAALVETIESEYRFFSFPTQILIDVDGNGEADLFASSQEEGDGVAAIMLRSDGAFQAAGPVFTGVQGFGGFVAAGGNFTGADAKPDLVILSQTVDEAFLIY